MPIHVRDGGSWREVTDPQVRVSGTWQPVQEGWVRVSGTWQRFYTRAVVNLDGHVVDDQPNGGFIAGVIARSDGTMDQELTTGVSQIDSSTDWIIPNGAASSDYSIRATVTVGSLDSGTTGTWQNLGSDRSWYKTSGTSCTILLEISDDGGSTVIASASYQLVLT